MRSPGRRSFERSIRHERVRGGRDGRRAQRYAYWRVRIVNVNAEQEDAIYVIDDFLRDPHVVRRLGLQAEYPVPPETPWYPGRNSRRAYPIAALDETVGYITGHAVTPLPDSAHTKFRLCLADEIGKGGVHIDNCHWTGVFFLTLDEHARGGTDFFRHRPSGTLRAPVYAEDWQNWPFDTVAKLWNDVIHPHTNDASKWELVRPRADEVQSARAVSSVAVAQRGGRLRRSPRQWALDLCAVLQLRVTSTRWAWIRGPASAVLCSLGPRRC